MGNWPKPMAIVEVEWVDSIHHTAWDTPDTWHEYVQSIHSKAGCKSVGYLFEKTTYSLALMQSQGRTGNVADAIVIPRRAILRIRELEHPQKKVRGESSP